MARRATACLGLPTGFVCRRLPQRGNLEEGGYHHPCPGQAQPTYSTSSDKFEVQPRVLHFRGPSTSCGRDIAPASCRWCRSLCPDVGGSCYRRVAKPLFIKSSSPPSISAPRGLPCRLLGVPASAGMTAVDWLGWPVVIFKQKNWSQRPMGIAGGRSQKGKIKQNQSCFS